MGCSNHESVKTNENNNELENKEISNEKEKINLDKNEEILEVEFEGITKFCKELIDEVNNIRKDPTIYINKISHYKSFFNGLILKIPESKYSIKTEEGAKAYEEAENFLKSAPTIDEELIPSKGLCRIAQDYFKKVQNCDDDNELNSINIEEIIDKYGGSSGKFSKIIEFGGNTPENVIINVVVNDGNKSREKRNSLFDNSFTKVGVATGSHPIYRYVSIILLCNNFDNKLDRNDTIDDI